MNYCRTCKYWTKVEEWATGHHQGLGLCDNVPMLWNATIWNKEGERVLSDKYKDTKAFAQDGSDYTAYLLTAPDFGCVSHEPK